MQTVQRAFRNGYHRNTLRLSARRVDGNRIEELKKIADEMGYQPNKVASFMRTKKSNIIAVVISSLSSEYTALIRSSRGREPHRRTGIL